MATKSLLKNGMCLVQHIQREGTIHKFDLMDKASMSQSSFEKLAPYIKHRWGQYFEYNRKTGIYTKTVVINQDTGEEILF